METDQDMISSSNLTFSISIFFVALVRTTNAHFSSKFKSALASMSKATGTTMSTQAAACLTRKENANTEQEVRATKVTGSVAGIMTNRSVLFRLFFLWQWLREDDDGLDFLPSLHAKLLPQVAGPYAGVPQELWMLRGKITEQMFEFFTLSTDEQCWPNLCRHQIVIEPSWELLRSYNLGSKR